MRRHLKGETDIAILDLQAGYHAKRNNITPLRRVLNISKRRQNQVSDQIAILLPRPSRVSEIIRPSGFRHKDTDSIRRDSEYLDIVDKIWSSLRTYVE